MNKLVYLYELDSVRNSAAEISYGQKVMFQEIVENGNTIVLSFNQLTDSYAFLAAIQNKDTYQHILDLMEMGKIKFSQFGNVRTASAYVQGELEKNLCSTENTFIFSGVPIKKDDREILFYLRDALKYSDTAIFKDLIETKKRAEELETLEYIKRYADLILAISTQDVVKNPAGDKRMPFSAFMNQVIQTFKDGKSFSVNEDWEPEFKGLAENILELLGETISLLSNIREKLKDGGLEERSSWYDKILPRESRKQAEADRILKKTDKEVLCLAEAIVDLCYNYAVETSIVNVSRHYVLWNEDISGSCGKEQMFQSDFVWRLLCYWKQYKSGMHQFLVKDQEEELRYEGKMPDWEMAARIIKREQWFDQIDSKKTFWARLGFGSSKLEEISESDDTTNKQDKKNDLKEVALYEADFEGEQKCWRKKNHRIAMRVHLTNFIGFILFVILQFILGLVDLHADFSVILNLLCSVIVLVVTDIISSTISDGIGLMDIRQSIESSREAHCDYKEICQYQKKGFAGYRNPNISSAVWFEPTPLKDRKETPLYLEEWNQYMRFKTGRKSAFKKTDENNSSVPYPIVTDAGRVREYEIRTGKKIGVIYQSAYNVLLCDLIQGKDNKPENDFVYERLLPAVEQGAIVTLPFFEGKIVLLRQYRHALQDFQYAIPRGFGEKGIADADNVDKELEEEIGAKVLKKEQIGMVVADSGMNGNKVSVFWCEVSKPVLKEKYEGIEKLKLVTEAEMEEMIANHEIDDGFTLSAYCFYQMWKKKGYTC